MAEIINVYTEHFPALRFIGKRYSNTDRGSGGGYSEKWCEWFQNGWFDSLEGLKHPDIENGHIGLCRCDWIDFENNFQYWIGMFLPAGTAVPPGYDFVDYAEGDIGVCWIKGREDGGIYAMHDECVAEFEKRIMNPFRRDAENKTCFFERYNNPRFTEKDEQGNVVLDYCVYITV